jgi:hypothetical protein
MAVACTGADAYSKGHLMAAVDAALSAEPQPADNASIAQALR